MSTPKEHGEKVEDACPLEEFQLHCRWAFKTTDLTNLNQRTSPIASPWYNDDNIHHHTQIYFKLNKCNKVVQFVPTSALTPPPN